MGDYQPTLVDKALLAIDHFQEDKSIPGIVMKIEGHDSLPIWFVEELYELGYEYAKLDLEGEHHDMIHWREIELGEYALPIVILEEENGQECKMLRH